jgi:hypothetical protein
MPENYDTISKRFSTCGTRNISGSWKSRRWHVKKDFYVVSIVLL